MAPNWADVRGSKILNRQINMLWINVIKHKLGRELFPHQASFTLVLPLRWLILSMEELAAWVLSITEQPGDPDLMRQATVRVLSEQEGFEYFDDYRRRKHTTVRTSGSWKGI